MLGARVATNLNRERELLLVGVGVHLARERKLLEVVRALHTARRLASRLHRRKKETN